MRDVRVRDVPMRDVPALVGRTGDVRTGREDAHAEKTLSHLCLFPFVSFLFPLSCRRPLFLLFSSRFASFSSLSFRSTQYNQRS